MLTMHALTEPQRPRRRLELELGGALMTADHYHRIDTRRVGRVAGPANKRTARIAPTMNWQDQLPEKWLSIVISMIGCSPPAASQDALTFDTITVSYHKVPGVRYRNIVY